jgi:tetratricopeptide (TPR) repeat protein
MPVGWEDVLPGMGRPQGIINEKLHACDYFVLVLWNRWGTPPGKPGKSTYTSGTEEEYNVARTHYDDPHHPLRAMVVFFKGVAPAQLNDPGPQLKKVLKFRKKLEQSREILFKPFDTTPEFERALRGLLGEWRRDHEDGKAQKKGAIAPPSRLTPPESEVLDSSFVSPSKSDLDNAWLLADQSKLLEAEIIFARSIARGDDPEAFRSYGAFLLRTGRRTLAEVMFQRILELAPSHGSQWAAVAYGNLGLLRELSGDLSGAEELQKKSLAIHQELSRWDGIAQVDTNLGIIAKRRGDLILAERFFQSAAENSLKTPRKDITARAYNNLGLLYRDQQEYTNSQRMHEQALAIAEEINDQQEIATVCTNLGVLHFDLGQLTVAADFFARALLLSRQLGFQQGTTVALAGQAAILLSQGRPIEAEPLFREVLELNVGLGQTDAVASALANLGVIAAHRGDTDAALRYLDRALETYAELGEPLGEAAVEEQLGELYRMVGKTERCLAVWLQSLAHFERMGLKQRADSLRKRLEAVARAGAS